MKKSQLILVAGLSFAIATFAGCQPTQPLRRNAGTTSNSNDYVDSSNDSNSATGSMIPTPILTSPSSSNSDKSVNPEEENTTNVSAPEETNAESFFSDSGISVTSSDSSSSDSGSSDSGSSDSGGGDSGGSDD